MVAVVVCVSRVGGSPLIAALRIPPGRGAGCADTDGALGMTRNTIIRAVRAIESPAMKVVDIRAYPLETRTALVRLHRRRDRGHRRVLADERAGDVPFR